MKKIYVLVGLLACTCLETFGVELNYEAMIKRSDPWEYVNKIPREKPSEFWLSLINNNQEYLKLKEKMDHPTKLYTQAANDYAYDRNRKKQYYNLQKEYNRLLENEITDSLTKIFCLEEIDKDAEFFFVDVDDLNANCDSYGKMRIFTKLVNELTFPELIAVCAHEMSHHILKHILASEYSFLKKQKRNQVWAEIGTGLTVGAVVASQAYAGVYGTQNNTDWGTYAQNVYNDLSNDAYHASANYYYRYSREEEAEADIIAFRFLQWLGYDGYEFITMLKKIDDGIMKKTKKNDNHPVTIERIRLIGKLYKKDGKQDPLEFVFENPKKEENAFIHNCGLIFDRMTKFGWLDEQITKDDFTIKLQDVSFANGIYRRLKSEYCYGIGDNENDFMKLIGIRKK
ncbi:MAG: M48 family metalloprotease [Prevotella sp.]|nr:M48 family metalloprotease [Prevotella sp.]